MEQSASGRDREQRGDDPTARRLAGHRHLRRVATEPGDVVAHPRQRGQHIRQCDIGFRTIDHRPHVGEPEGTDAVVDRDHHDVTLRGHPGAS